MRKIIVCSALLISIVACNSTNSSNNDNAPSDTAHNTGLTNPSSIDTTKHPDGVTNGSVISTDTAAINVQNSVNKAKETKANK